MKTLSTITLAIITSTLLLGCGSSDSKSTDKLTQPKADYAFTDADKDDILAEREPLTKAMNLQLNQQQFNQVNFVHKDAYFTLFELSSDEGNHLTLMLANGQGENTHCVIYHSSDNMETFQCAQKDFTQSDDTSVLQNQPTTQYNVVNLEYQHGLLEYGDMLGSTRLTFNPSNHGDEIITSFAFDGFYQDVMCDQTCAEVQYSALGASTYIALETLQEEQNMTGATLVFNNPIAGSLDDEINLYSGLLIRDNQLNTKVSKTGSVFSGGTDLFAAGVERILEVGADKSAIEKNKQIGVHSWAEHGKPAKSFPYSYEGHRMQATYATKMLGDNGIPFYLFTLDAAPADGEHQMTRQELEKYALVTEFID